MGGHHRAARRGDAVCRPVCRVGVALLRGGRDHYNRRGHLPRRGAVHLHGNLQQRGAE